MMTHLPFGLELTKNGNDHWVRLQISRSAKPYVLSSDIISSWPVIVPRARVSLFLPQIFRSQNWWIHLRLILNHMVDDIIEHHAPSILYQQKALDKDVHTAMKMYNSPAPTHCHFTQKMMKERLMRILPFSSQVDRGIRKPAVLDIGDSVPSHKQARHQQLLLLHGLSLHCSKRMKAKFKVLALVIVRMREDTINICPSKKVQ